MTSQIFSNIYLNEFDRFVRHNLKTQAYIRYGDDFLMLCPTRQQAYQARKQSVDFLMSKLRLTVNPKNDVVVSSHAGLKFLGHAITKDFAVVDKHTTKSVLAKLDWYNAASYRSLPLVKSVKARMDWILLDRSIDI